MKKILSITVPSYNAEKFLHKGIPTFLDERILDDIEVIIVDDGSKDRTAQIADEYQSKYPETVVAVHKENGGHGSGINTGIAVAKGTYFCVVDADDWVNTENFVKLVQYLKTTQVDLVLTNVDIVDQNGVKHGDELITGLMPEKEFDFSKQVNLIPNIEMHNFVIKKSILSENKIRCHEHHFYVDMEYDLYSMPYVRQAVFLEMPVYQYFVGREGQSVSIVSRRKNIGQYFEVIEYLLDYYKTKNANMTDSQKAYYLKKTAHFIGGLYSTLMSYKDWRSQKKNVQEFDLWLKKKSIEAYQANQYSSISILRKSKFMLFPLSSFFYRVINKIND